jgi:predicted metal-dependent HD superfamily phosphohydrolase
MKLKPEEWEDLWRRIGAKGDGRSIFQKITEAYEQKHRFYHNAEHIAECLNELRAAENLAGDRGNEIEMALWLHDFVYDPTRNDNEQLSAVVAREVCREGGLPPDFGARVDDLIMATRHAEDPSEEAAQLVVDIDLSILGKSADRFWKYEDDVRREYSFVPEELFRTKRAEILEGFLRRESIYHTELFRDQYEKQARENLAASIARLKQ